MWISTFNSRLFFLEKGWCNIKDLLINEQITANEVQVIGANGESLGNITLNDAIEKAQEDNMDLVLVSPTTNPPVCKIMNYGKYRFEQKKKEKESKKNQKGFDLKEIRVTPNTDIHDYEFKAKNVRKFIMDGDKVKVTVRFRGREVNNSAMGEKILGKFIEDLSDVAVLEKKPFLEGKNMFIILAPNK